MIADVAIIVGIYAFVRLLHLVAPPGEGGLPTPGVRGLTVVAMAAVALLTADIVYQSVQTTNELAGLFD